MKLRAHWIKIVPHLSLTHVHVLMVQGAYTLAYIAHRIHVAQTIVILQPCFAQANCHIAICLFAMAMALRPHAAELVLFVCNGYGFAISYG